MPYFDATYDASSLAVGTGFTISGLSAGDRLGASISNAGDVNNDGIDDFIIGAPEANGGKGEAYVVFGRQGSFAATFDLSTLNGTNGFAITTAGSAAGLQGYSVSAAGDVNNDGIDDILVGAPETGGTDFGTAHVIYGSANPFAASIDMFGVAPPVASTFRGSGSNDAFGESVAGIGDFNGDGIDDFAVGVPGASANAGYSYVVFGQTGDFAASVDAGDIANGTQPGFQIGTTLGNGQMIGTDVTGIGDVNGDGLDDLLVSAPLADVGGNADQGQAYVIYGNAAAPDVNVGLLSSATGFAIDGFLAGQELGSSVAGVGDVDGDGTDDFLVGSESFGVNNADLGSAYLFFGDAQNTSASVGVNSLDGSTGYRFIGLDLGDNMGSSVAHAGDIDGDGFEDFIIGAANADGDGNTIIDAGEAYVVLGGQDNLQALDTFGGTTADGIIDLGDLNGNNGFRVVGGAAGDGTGGSVAGIGDVNDDGFADIAVGAPGTGSDAGAVSIIYGRGPGGVSVTRNGSEADQTIYGGVGSDTLRGFGGDDTLLGAAGSDTLVGGDGDDTLIGGGNNDVLDGGAGADALIGGDGNDTVTYAGALTGVQVNLTTGVATGDQTVGDTFDSIESVRGSNFIDALTGDGNANTLRGLDGSDVLDGLDGADELFGGGGNDVLHGGGANDILSGDIGNDELHGDGGNDNLSGGMGDDELFGGEGNDTLRGNSDHDELYGGAGIDDIQGGGGNDFLEGGSGADTLRGNAGTDTVSYASSDAAVEVSLRLNGVIQGGHAQGDTITEMENIVGSTFGDTLTGNSLANLIQGGDGDDILDGFSGADTLEGGDGDDILIGGDAADILDGGAGSDTASYADRTNSIILDMSNGTVSGPGGGDTFISIENLIGTGFSDIITGNGFDNVLEGGGSADTINGGGGSDTASYAGAASAVTANLANTNVNTGDAAGDGYTSIENLRGSAHDDTLTGNGFDNVLEGGGGADVLNGGGGSDTASYDHASATVIANLNNSNVNTGDAAGDTYSDIENLTGSDFTDALTGDGFANVLNGGAGNDFLTGNAGDDTLVGGAGGDRLDGGAGADVLDGGDAFDIAFYKNTAAGAVTVDLDVGVGSGGDAQGDTYVSVEQVAGSFFSDTLLGDAGINGLSGSGGNDILDGRGGNDSLFGSVGNDTFRFQDNHGRDRILDFTDGEDMLDYSQHTGVSSFADLTVFDNGANTIIQDGQGGQVVLLGAAGTVDASDFVF